MAEQVGVRIGSKFDKTGVDQASAGVKGFATSADKSSKKVGKSFIEMTAKFYLAVKAIQKLKKVFVDLTDAYGKQDDVERKLAAASKNNPYINGTGVRGLIAYASELQNVSRFGDEAIIDQQSFLVALGHSEETIRAVTLAAVEFASTGQVNLETAFKQMNQTLSGSTGRLGLMIPALKELTVEELKAGDGLQVIIDKFQGMKEASVEGFAGIKIQMQNTFGDIKEDIGEVFANLFDTAGWKEKLEEVAQWFEDNKGNIYAVFTNIPAIAAIALKSVQNMITEVFNPTNFNDILAELSNAIALSFTLAFARIPVVFGEVIKVVKTSLLSFANTALTGFIDNAKIKIQEIIEKLGGRYTGQALLTTEQRETQRVEGVDGVFTFGGSTQDEQDAANKAAQQQLIASFKVIFSTTAADMKEILGVIRTGAGVIGDVLSEEAARAVGEMAVLIDAANDGLEDAVDAVEEAADAVEEAADAVYTIPAMAESILPRFKGDAVYHGWLDKDPSAIYTGKGGKGFFGGKDTEFNDPDYGGTVTGGAGELGALLAGGDPLMMLINSALGAAMANEELAEVLNFVTTAMGALFEIIGGPLSAALTPVIEHLKMVGESLGKLIAPILYALAPILNIVVSVLNTLMVPSFQVLSAVLSPVVLTLELLSPLLVFFAMALEVLMAPLRFLGDLLAWVGDHIRAFGQKISLFLSGNWRQARDVTGPGEFSSDAWAGLSDRLETIQGLNATGAESVDGTTFGIDDGTSGGIYGGNTNVNAPPIYNVYVSAEEVYGVGGTEEFGRIVAEALVEYIGAGGQPAFLEAN